MPPSQFQKRIGYFFLWVALIVTLLVIYPVVQEGVIGSLAVKFGVLIARDWTITIPDGVVPDKMMNTTVSVVHDLLLILKIILWMSLVIVIVRFVGYVVTKTLNRNATQGEISSLIKTVLSVSIYIVAFFIIFQSQFPAVQLAPLFTGSTIIGIVVGLALQETLGNLFAGLALQADQPFQVGDVISIANRGSGIVESVSWRGVKIRTFENKLLVISNAVIGKEAIEVAPRNNLNARKVHFSTDYSESPAQIAHAVREAIHHSENVSTKLRPNVRIRDLGPSSIDWEVKYWLDDYSKFSDTDALVRNRIWYAFHREKLRFATPSQDVFLKRKAVEMPFEEKVNIRAERLNQVSIFNPLSDSEIEALAGSTKSRVFAPGESIVRAGQPGRSMFVIVRGSVKVQVPESDYLRTVNTLEENDFFGEMGLLTGEPRTANVTAVDETEVLQIRKEGLKPILENNPQLIESISEMMEKRRIALTPLTAAENEDHHATERKSVIMRIRKFFGVKHG